ncbi:MAG: nitroreductase, partial [Chloroflexota bacterium]
PIIQRGSMNLADAIRTRRSVGVFTDQPVDPALVLELIETSVWVPNHRLTEPWRFVFLGGSAAKRYAEIRREMALDACGLEDAEARRQVGDGTYAKFSGIPAFLAVIMKQHPDPETREEDYAACCCLTQNFLLLAWERGLGTFWKTFKRDVRLRQLLSLDNDETVVAWLHLGTPDGTIPTSRRTPPHERLTILSE